MNLEIDHSESRELDGLFVPGEVVQKSISERFGALT